MDAPRQRRAEHVGPGLRDDITIRKYSSEPAECDIELIVDADLADLFEVKGGRAAAEAIVRRSVHDGELHIEAERNGQRRGAAIRAAGAHIREDALTFRVDIPPRGHWSTPVIVVPLIDGKGPDEPFTETASPTTGPAYSGISPGGSMYRALLSPTGTFKTS